MAGARTGTKQDAVRQRVLRSRDRFWTPRDFSGSPSTVLHTLAALVDAGELRHVRKGLYWRGTKTLLGMSPPPADKLVETLLGKDHKHGVGPAGASAANWLRLSTQVPRYRHVAVPTRPPTGVPQVTFHDRSARAGRTQARLAPQEIAVLEVLDGWEKLLEVPADEAWKRLGELVTHGQVRPERLAQAARTEPARVRTRLAQLFARAGQTDALQSLARATKQPDLLHA